MALHFSHIFSDFIVDNQLYTNNYGATEKAYRKFYDEGGNLLCVITPMAAPLMATKGTIWTDTDAATAPLTQCFRYGYDSYMRLRSKKSPDAVAVK